MGAPTTPLLHQEHETLLDDQRRLLDRMVALARTVDRDGADHEVAQALRRHVDERFLLVVVGEVKAGKSSFINVLLGREICAVGPTPLTDRIHVLQYGAPEADRVVEQYLVERDLELDLLREISIVDTPGTNSILREHSALTERFIPRADLVLFLTSIDRPLSESESHFLALIAERWRKKVAFLLTKVDGRDPADVQAVVAWLRQQCLAHHRFEPVVLPVSARLEKTGFDGGFVAVREFVRATLAEGEKMRLKLESPLRSGDAVLQAIGATLQRRSTLLDGDFRAVQDLDRQVDQAARDLKERAHRPITEIYDLFQACEQRARVFFDRHARLKALSFGKGEAPLRETFEREVLAELEAKYREVVGRAIDWIVKEEIALYERCTTYLNERVAPADLGRALPAAPARFEYRREEVFRAILDGFAKESGRLDIPGESRRFLAEAESGMKKQLAITVGAVGVGAGTIALLTKLTAVWLSTGLVLAAGLGLGSLAILPAVRRRALRRFTEKLDLLLQQVRGAFAQAIDAEVDGARDRLRRAWEPFLLFHRSEASTLAEQQRELKELRIAFEELAQRVARAAAAATATAGAAKT